MDPATYFDDLAAFYDATTPEQGDVAFYRDLALEADGRVLEVGCGTGRIYLELLRAGVDAEGIDPAGEMLSVLREKAAAEGLDPSVREEGATGLDADAEYALVIVPFRTFLLLDSPDEQLTALERIHAALEPGGRLALNAFVPDPQFVAEHYGEPTEREIEVDGESYTLRTVTELVDDVEWRARVSTTVLDDGEPVAESDHRLRLVTKPEFELLFRLSPFSEWAVYGGFEYEALESANQEQVWIATR